MADVEADPRYAFLKADIRDADAMAKTFTQFKPDGVVHLAAESHVDRSIVNASDFIMTDVYGTSVLLEAARNAEKLRRFIQVSTDEVYGSVSESASRETDEIRPSNPYSASKAGADRLAYSFWATHRTPIVIARASNNYGPNQFPEKVIPLFITNAIDDRTVPLYGDGLNIRDWLHVDDHCRALDLLIADGELGEAYNVGGGHEIANIELTRELLRLLNKPESLIQCVDDRPGHDHRYCLDTTKLRKLGWQPVVDFVQGLTDTVTWYQENESWWRPIKRDSPAFKTYYQEQYGHQS